jgi:hypothetical protein
VAGDRDSDPHDHHRGQKQHAIQNTHRGQHNKLHRPRLGRTGGRGFGCPARIAGLPSII